MKNDTLEAFVADMARDPDVTARKKGAGFPDGRDDLEACSDPLLADLHRRYLEALACHRKVIRENGPHDAMTVVAADMLDSARCAVQTRMIELVGERAAEARNTAETQHVARRAAALEAAQVRADLDRCRKARRDEEDYNIFFWFAMLYWVAGRTLFAARKTLSASSDFALACRWQVARHRAFG